MNILGLSFFYHDSAAALIQDGRVVAAAEEERFSRKKHDHGFPANAIRFCLDSGGLEAADLDYVVFYEKPLQKFERILLSSLRTFPRSWRTFGEAMINWFDEKLWVKGLLQKELDITEDRILFTDHHMSHAASSFFCSPFQEAAILTLDGVGEWTTTAMGTARSNGDGSHDIVLDREIRFPHSLGLLYSAFTAWLGFRVNNGEYKVMGMAPYGEPRYVDMVGKVVHVADDGSFWLDMDYFDFHHSPDRTFGDRFIALFGEPRGAEEEFFTSGTHPELDPEDPAVRRNQYYADVAASIQRVTEEIVVRMARHLHERTGLTRLCMAGGVALNSVANGRVLREGPFDEIFIQPAAGDSGGALGAALYVWHVLLGKPRAYVMESAYLGREYGPGEIRTALDAAGHSFQEVDDRERLAGRIVEEITSGRVVALFQGRFEWGPRALGNRSILADPRSAEMKDVVNRMIKFREPFRPFAPVVPADSVNDFFQDGHLLEGQYPVRFMLMVAPWREDVGARVPAVNHMGTGRLQTVRPEWNPLYAAVLRGFGEATGIPVLMNTSFNLRGEPMVASPEDACRTYEASGIDVLVLENHLVTKG